MVRVVTCLLAVFLTGCGQTATDAITLRVSASAVGAEREVLSRQVARFTDRRPGVRVVLTSTPDAADQRHQLYVQWLNTGSATPDVLQLDIVWTPEFAAAGWILPLGGIGADDPDFFDQTLEANRWEGRLYALPLFVDVGMLYWRTDLMERPPERFEDLASRAAPGARDGIEYGFVWQGARYEGLVTVFLEHLVGFGGRILDEEGRVVVDSDAAVRALAFMRECLADGVVPAAALAWHEEQTRFAFERGEAVFMRNWPYAVPLLEGASDSRVAGRFAVAPMPSAPGGHAAAALGGAQLAINANSRHPDLARELIAYLTAPEQVIERAKLAGQYPARRSVYDDPRLAAALPIGPARAREIIERATPRPVTPVYEQLSSALQVHLHRALSGQSEPAEALSAAASEMRRILAELDAEPRAPIWSKLLATLAPALLLLAAAIAWGVTARRRPRRAQVREDQIAWLFAGPTLLVIALIAVFPLLWTVWESLHLHDLRMPWKGEPFVGAQNYLEMTGDDRFWGALAHTAVFTGLSVALELGLGLALALALDRVVRGRGALRATVLLPWAMPTVVAALVWQYLFSDTGFVNRILVDAHVLDEPMAWFAGAVRAWVPIVLADVWKTTPFVALLLLAGLQAIDDGLYEAARADGAGPWQQLAYITLPLLRPALLVVLVFRTLDAFRIFDLVYVLTGGGPGTATEPIALYTFDALLQDLRFGYGSALSVIIFAVAFALALVLVRLLGRDATEARP